MSNTNSSKICRLKEVIRPIRKPSLPTSSNMGESNSRSSVKETIKATLVTISCPTSPSRSLGTCWKLTILATVVGQGFSCCC